MYLENWVGEPALASTVRAAAQLETADTTVNIGESVWLVFVRGPERALAWDLAEQHDPRKVDVKRYTNLLLRSASTVLQPLGAHDLPFLYPPGRPGLIESILREYGIR